MTVDDTPTILVVDDVPENVRLLEAVLTPRGYNVVSATDGEAALELVAAATPDLVLLDVVMPGMSGYEVCQKIRTDGAHGILPVVMVTALDPSGERIKGLEAGADDFLTKPINIPELLARVKSLLRIKQLYDTVESQAAELAELNRTLEQRVTDQVGQLERLSKLKRFFSPQLAEAIVSGGADDPLRTHRREVTVVFLDLRGYTAFAETADPEEVMGVLREYHQEMGTLVLAHEGTLERFAGDGMMVFFNDPVVVPNPEERAIRMSISMRDRVVDLAAGWRKRGYDLDVGLGLAKGFATIGAIGFEGRWDYGAIGTVTNLAFRLCGEARPGQVLAAKRVVAAVDELVEAETVGDLTLKGFSRPVATVSLVRLRGA